MIIIIMIVILIVSCCRDASALRRSDALIQSSLHVYYIYIYILYIEGEGVKYYTPEFAKVE